MGIFNLFGSNKSSKPAKKNAVNKDLPRSREELKRKAEELRLENKKWEQEFNKLISYREKAQKLEKEKKLKEALLTYKDTIHFGENSTKLQFNNFVFDIQRVIIILSKTKQTDLLSEFLKEKIKEYPGKKETDNWKKRLNKLNTK